MKQKPIQKCQAWHKIQCYTLRTGEILLEISSQCVMLWLALDHAHTSFEHNQVQKSVQTMSTKSFRRKIWFHLCMRSTAVTLTPDWQRNTVVFRQQWINMHNDECPSWDVSSTNLWSSCLKVCLCRNPPTTIPAYQHILFLRDQKIGKPACRKSSSYLYWERWQQGNISTTAKQSFHTYSKPSMCKRKAKHVRSIQIAIRNVIQLGDWHATFLFASVSVAYRATQEISKLIKTHQENWWNWTTVARSGSN